MKNIWKIVLIMLNFSALDLRSDDMSRTRSEVPKDERWNVDALYPSVQEWKKEFDSTKGQSDAPHWPELKAYESKLKDPKAMARFFEGFFELDRKLTKLYTYSQMRLDEDLANDEFKQINGAISGLYHDFQLEYSWLEPELLSLNESEFQHLTMAPQLKPYRFFLEKIGRMRPHILSSQLEELMALSGKALETSYKAFGAMNNADLKFAPAETSQGEKKELTNGTYLVYMRDPDRNLRKSSFVNLHKGYEAFSNTLCELIQGQVQAHFFQARAKKFKDCREAALFPARIDPAVYDNLITTIHQYLPALHQYMHFRKEQLGLDELHPYDLYVPLTEESSIQMKFSDACQIVIDSVAPLGVEYQNVLRTGLTQQHWVDPFENQNKRGGAYSGGCFDSFPYILMSFHGTLNDVLTLAHESGHSMHSYLSRHHQPYIYADYPIFVAEVASTFNEQLLLKYLKERAKTQKDRAYLINYELEAIRTTIFRQALFAEFELKLHNLVEQGITLTPSLLKETYLELNKLYYGPDLVLDGGIEIEWARIPHFYYDFYVYQYATGLSAALALFEKASVQDEARKKYLQFLSSGGSHYPLDLLQLAGVDLKSPTTVESAMKRFSQLLEELKKALAESRE